MTGVAAHAPGASRDALLARLRADDMVSDQHFSTPAELTELLADDLAVLLTERFTRRRKTNSAVMASWELMTSP